MKKLTFFLLVMTLYIHGLSQKWEIKSYNFGYRIFEYSSKGNNPVTIGGFLKDQASYTNFLNSFTYNGLSGNPSITYLHTFFLNAEINKPTGLTNFWKKHSLQLGLFVTEYDKRSTGSIDNIFYPQHPDTTRIAYQYSLEHRHQFLGLNVGINRRLIIGKNFRFLIGIHAQGSFTMRNIYHQQIDTLIYGPQIGWLQSTTKMPQLKGRKYLQTQLLLPLGLEVDLTKKKNYSVRLEFNLGIVNNRYRTKTFYDREAHGVGIWFVYKPTRR